MKCPECQKAEMVQVQSSKGFSMAGVLAALIFVASLFMLAFSNIAGGLIGVLVAILIGVFGRGKDDELVCPLCKHRITL
jgi:uncharacterized protein YbaR (Trm112 family)